MEDSLLKYHITSNFLKAVFHKFYLVYSWIPWPISAPCLKVNINFFFFLFNFLPVLIPLTYMLDYGNTEKIKVFGLGALCLCEKYNKTICNYRFSLYSPYFPVSTQLLYWVFRVSGFRQVSLAFLIDAVRINLTVISFFFTFFVV